jgi:hypothetical protein
VVSISGCDPLDHFFRNNKNTVPEQLSSVFFVKFHFSSPNDVKVLIQSGQFLAMENWSKKVV